ncbi:MAG: hypothetical protein CM1200mP22_16830 [Dehalococcoidia bacterium]|nr:MAG: hypothetical protein CM1200mP22_16830 [Dehalococcoidia bacterium]
MDYAKQISPESWRDVPAFKQALLDYRRVSGKEESYWTRTATYSTKFHVSQVYGNRGLSLSDGAERGYQPQQFTAPVGIIG